MHLVYKAAQPTLQDCTCLRDRTSLDAPAIQHGLEKHDSDSMCLHVYGMCGSAVILAAAYVSKLHHIVRTLRDLQA